MRAQKSFWQEILLEYQQSFRELVQIGVVGLTCLILGLSTASWLNGPLVDGAAESVPTERQAWNPPGFESETNWTQADNNSNVIPKMANSFLRIVR